MPQLDFTIIFTQIFWLVLVFIFCYSFIIHIFLPKFLLALRSRTLIIQCNKRELLNLKNNFAANQNELSKILSSGLSKIKFFHSVNFLTNFKYISPNRNLEILDIKLIKVTLDLMLYCDEKVLNCIPFFSKTYNTFNCK